LFFIFDSAEEIVIPDKETKKIKKNIEAAKGIENMSENIEIEKIEKVNEIIKAGKKTKQIITDTEDKKYEKRQGKYKKYVFAKKGSDIEEQNVYIQHYRINICCI